MSTKAKGSQTDLKLAGDGNRGFGSLVLGAGQVSSMKEIEREIIHFVLFRFLVFIFYFFNRWCSLLGLVGLSLLE